MVPLVDALSWLLGAIAIRMVWRNCISVYLSPLRTLGGPPCPSPFYGHVRQIFRAANSHITQQMVKDHGSNMFCRWLFMVPCLWTMDPQAIRHVMHSSNYIKPWEFRIPAARVVGNSVLVAEGDKHKGQRIIMNPAFGPAQIRELVHIFVEKSAELRDVWLAEIAAQGGCARIDVVSSLKKMTLDVIGLAGFGYNLDALKDTGEPNELARAFHHIFNATPPVSIYRIVMDMFPFLDFFPDERTKTIREAHVVMRRIGTELIRDKKAAFTRELASQDSGVAKTNVHGRDLLSLLIKANMATDIPDNQRLTDEEVLSQIPTFLVAGHETTSTAAAWCLFALAQSPRAQQKLREELLSAQTESPSMDDLNALPYLDCVVREALRLHAPVALMLRAAEGDDVIPTSEPFVDRNGRTQHEIRIGKGNRVIMSILALNHSTAIWGDDALEFRPERWEDPPEDVSHIPGVWGHMLTFSGGPHACIGYRFSIAELKALLFILVRALTFEFAADPADVTSVGMFTQRPALRSELAKGAQLPFYIRPYVAT